MSYDLLDNMFKVDLNISMFSVLMVYNIFDPDPLINCIILPGKPFIYRCKASESKPIFSMFKGLIAHLTENHSDVNMVN